MITGTENTPGVSQFRLPPELAKEIQDLLPEKWREVRSTVIPKYTGNKKHSQAGGQPESEPLRQAASAQREEAVKKQRFSLLGMEARNTNLSMLNKARQMDMQNEDPDKIWRETGFAKSPYDGLWRWEISNKDLNVDKQIKRSKNTLKPFTVNLEEIEGTRELIENYPQYRNMPITFKYEGTRSEGTTAGGYMAKDNEGRVSVVVENVGYLSPSQVRRALIHELQHAIQEVEGFDKGTGFNLEGLKTFEEYRGSTGEIEARMAEDRDRKRDAEANYIYDYPSKEDKSKRIHQPVLKDLGEMEKEKEFLETHKKVTPGYDLNIIETPVGKGRRPFRKEDLDVKEEHVNRTPKYNLFRDQAPEGAVKLSDKEVAERKEELTRKEESLDRLENEMTKTKTVNEFLDMVRTGWPELEHRIASELRDVLKQYGFTVGKLLPEDVKLDTQLKDRIKEAVTDLWLENRKDLKQLENGQARFSSVFYNPTIEFLTEGKGKSQKSMTVKQWVAFGRKSGSKGVFTDDELRVSGLNKILETDPDRKMKKDELLSLLESAEKREGALFEHRLDSRKDRDKAKLSIEENQGDQQWKELTDLGIRSIYEGDRLVESNIPELSDMYLETSGDLFERRGPVEFTYRTPWIDVPDPDPEAGFGSDEEVMIIITMEPSQDFDEWFSEGNTFYGYEYDSLYDNPPPEVFDEDGEIDEGLLMEYVEDTMADPEKMSEFKERYDEEYKETVPVNTVAVEWAMGWQRDELPGVLREVSRVNDMMNHKNTMDYILNTIKKKSAQQVKKVDEGELQERGYPKPVEGTYEEAQSSKMGAYSSWTLNRGHGPFQDYRTLLITSKNRRSHGSPYTEKHWKLAGENALAHLRMTTQKVDGQWTTMLEEGQSDWASDTRDQHYDPYTEEFVIKSVGKDGKPTTERIPKDSPEGRHLSLPPVPPMKKIDPLIVKRALAEAIEQGTNRLAWTTPEQQAARYGVELSRNIEEAYLTNLNRNDSEGKPLFTFGFRTGSSESQTLTVTQEGLAEYVGTERAKHLVEKVTAPGADKFYKIQDTDFIYAPVGKGMIHQYADAIPRAIKEVFKPYVGKKGLKDLIKYGEFDQNTEYKAQNILPKASKEAIQALDDMGVDHVDITSKDLDPQLVRGLKLNHKYAETRKRSFNDRQLGRDVDPVLVPTEQLRQDLQQMSQHPYVDIPEEMVRDYKRKGFPKYNLSKPQKDLIAIHNMRQSVLEQLVEEKGLISPSIAITRKGVPFHSFGEISLVLNKDAIDPKKSRKNLVYPQDAYTPRRNNTARKYDKKQLKQKLKDLGTSKFGEIDSYELSYDFNVKNYVSSNQEALADLYLKSQGKESLKDWKYKSADISPDNVRAFELNLALPDGWADANSAYSAVFGLFNGENKKNEILHKSIADGYIKGQLRDYRKELLDKDVPLIETRKEVKEYKEALTEMFFSDGKLDSQALFNVLKDDTTIYYLFNAEQVERTGTRRKDLVETRRAFRELGADSYTIENWFKEYLKSAESGTVMQNEDGNWVKAGPNKILKSLTSPDPRGKEGGFTGSAGAARAKVNPPFKSLKQMADQSHRIVSEMEDEKEAFKQMYSDVKEVFADPNNNSFFNSDAADIMSIYSDMSPGLESLEQAAKRVDPNRDWSFTEEDVAQVDAFIKQAQEMPTEYFEAKPQRIVSNDEIALAVVPKDISESYKNMLRNEGIEVREYRDSDHRQEIVDSLDNDSVRFNLQKKRDTVAATKFKELDAKRENNLESLILRAAKNAGIVGISKDEIISLAIDPGTRRSDKIRKRAESMQSAIEETLDQADIGFDKNTMIVYDFLSEIEDLSTFYLDRDFTDSYTSDIVKGLLDGSLPSDVDYSGKEQVKASDLAKRGYPRAFKLDGIEYYAREKQGEIQVLGEDGTFITFDMDDTVYRDIPEKAPTVQEARKEAEEYLFQLEKTLMEYPEDSPEFNDALLALSYELQADRVAHIQKEETQKYYDSLQTDMHQDLDAPADVPFVLNEETRKRRFYRNFIDRFDNIKELEKAITAAQGKVNPDKSPYTTLELYPGRADEAIAKLDTTVNNAIALMVKKKITPEEMSDFLYAQHAPERNRSMAEKNEGRESLSGMSTDEANKIMEDFKKAGKHSTMVKIWEMLRKERERLNKELVNSGLRLEEIQEGYDAAWDYYVPLKGIEDQVKGMRGGSGKTRGFTAKDRQKEALGRVSKATDNVLARYVTDMADHAVQIEKVKVGQAVLKMVQDNPNPTFWEIDPPRTKPKFSKLLGSVVRVPDPYRREEPNVYPVIGPDGEEHLIVFHTPEGVALSQTLNGADQETSNKILQLSGRMNAFLGSLLTSYNPPFVISNALRDAQTAIYNIEVEEGTALAKKTSKGTAGALKGIYKTQRGKDSGEWGKYWREMQEAGGKTGFAAVPPVEEKLEEFQKKYDMSVATLKTMPVTKLKKMFKDFLDLVKDANTSVENAFRLSYYRALREDGKSKEFAASRAKNLTVNFNRKGVYGGDINKVFLFFNAAVQGSDRIYQAYRKNPKKFAKLSTYLFSIGLSLGLYNQLNSGEDDESGVTYWEKVPEYTKSSNFVFMLPEGKGAHIKVPMPYGFNVPVSLGVRLADMMVNPRTNRTNQAFGMVNDAINATNPIASSDLATAISPTIIRPIIELKTNQNFAGNPIYRKESPLTRGPSPKSSQYFKSTTTPFIYSAEYLNKLTGGDEYVSGKLDVYPDALEHLYEFFTGGTGKFFKDSYGTLDRALNGDFVPEKTPFLNKVYGADNQYYNQSQFFKADIQTKKVLQKGRKAVSRAKEEHRKLYKEYKGDIPDSLMTVIETEADSIARQEYGNVVVESLYSRLGTQILPRLRKSAKYTEGKNERELQDDIMSFFNRIKAKISPLQSKLGKLNPSDPQAEKIRTAIDKVVELETDKFMKAH